MEDDMKEHVEEDMESENITGNLSFIAQLLFLDDGNVSTPHMTRLLTVTGHVTWHKIAIDPFTNLDGNFRNSATNLHHVVYPRRIRRKFRAIRQSHRRRVQSITRLKPHVLLPSTANFDFSVIGANVSLVRLCLLHKAKQSRARLANVSEIYTFLTCGR
jgi:hypothetical protein